MGKKKLSYIDIIEVHDIISQHYDDSKFDINSLLEILGISFAELNEIYSEISYIKPREILEYQRIFKSMHLLEFTDLTVKEVALKCGYERYRTFSRAFKRLVGVSPIEYRKVSKNILKISESIISSKLNI